MSVHDPQPGDVWIDSSDHPIVVEGVTIGRALISRVTGSLEWLSIATLRRFYRRAEGAETERLWRSLLGSTAEYLRVGSNVDGTVTVRVIDVPGLQPGDEFRVTARAAREMERAA